MSRSIARDVALRHFHTVAAILAAGGVTAASTRIHRSAASISRSLALVERALGTALVERRPSGLVPTPAGALVAARCQAIRGDLDEARTLLARDHRDALHDGAALFQMQPDLAHLRAVIAVSDYQSVGRAAEFLGVSQPAVSYSLRLLETDLGLPLFARLKAGTIATPAGMIVTVCARRVLAEISKMHDDVRSIGGASTGLVRVGGLPYSRAVILPETIRLVMERCPGISVRTVEGPIESLISALHGDQVDAVICAYPERSLLDGIAAETIAGDPLAFFVARTHPLAGRAAVPLAALGAHPMILPPAGSITRKLLEDIFTHTGVEPPPGRVETSSSSLIRNLLLEGDFIAFRSLREFLVQIPDDRIVALDIAHDLPSRTISVLTRRGVRPTPATRDFLAVVRQVGAVDAPGR